MNSQTKLGVPQFSYELADGSHLMATRHSDAATLVQCSLAIKPNLGFCSKLAKRLLLGHEPWSFALERHGVRETVAFGARVQGRFGSSFDVSIIQELGAEHEFWRGLVAFANWSAVTQLMVEQIRAAVREPMIPAFRGESERYSNVKLYVWNLAGDSWDCAISANHRRNISRARKIGVKHVSLPREDAVREHMRLIGTSVSRRSSRGEPTKLASDAQEVREVLRTGQAELFQVADCNEVVSSKIVYTLGPFAYYDSGGTSERGMSIGASHFLMYSIADVLRKRGILSLDLDVASAAAGGLARFKADFGAEQWMVDRVRCNRRDAATLARKCWLLVVEFLGSK